MEPTNDSSQSFGFHWLTPDRWPDLEALFGPKGACDGCWCMYWRLRGKSFSDGSGGPNREAFQRIVKAREEPGILAYQQGKAVGWAALAPREVYPRLEHARVLYPVDDTPVWSITCFYVDKHYRKQGLTLALLEAVKQMAKAKGAKTLEGYPIEPQNGRMRDAYAYVGVASTFRNAGFVEVARRSPTRPIMRFDLIESPPAVD